jgi:hypothetical protein
MPATAGLSGYAIADRQKIVSPDVVWLGVQMCPAE